MDGVKISGLPGTSSIDGSEIMPVVKGGNTINISVRQIFDLAVSNEIRLEFNWSGTSLGVRVHGDTTYTYVNLKGDKGDEGVGILNITKDHTSGLSDIYKITFTDNTTTTFTVVNGSTWIIGSDLYWYKDGVKTEYYSKGYKGDPFLYSDFTIEQLAALKGDPGKSISSIEKTNTEGLVDTYTVTYSDNTTSTFTVTNGAPGSIGSGDAKDLTVSFTEAATRANIASGETIATLFGKAKKWFTDLKAVAFSGSYTDLTDKPTIPTKTSDLTNDNNLATTTNVNDAVTTHDSNASAHSDIRQLISNVTSTINTLVSGNASVAIDNFNEIIAFLANVTDSSTLEGIIAALNTSIAAKVDKVDGKGLSTNDFSNDYKAKLDFNYGSNAVTTLASLPVTKNLITASLSTATILSVASGLEVNQSIHVCATASAAFTQTIPNTGSYVAMNGTSFSITNGAHFEIDIKCVSSGVYWIMVSVQS